VSKRRSRIIRSLPQVGIESVHRLDRFFRFNAKVLLVNLAELAKFNDKRLHAGERRLRSRLLHCQRAPLTKIRGSAAICLNLCQKLAAAGSLERLAIVLIVGSDQELICSIDRKTRRAERQSRADNVSALLNFQGGEGVAR
jgi:hypothetical protein